MFNQGLSLDQAPPISVVLRFFMSVPLFGLLLSALMGFAPIEILTPNHPLSLAAIHLMFLGIITMSMIGALFQMQSVLGGRPIPYPVGNGWIIHTLFTIGVLSLAGAFVFDLPPLFVIAAVMLGAAVLYAANLVLPLLFGGITHDTLRGMRLSLIALALTAILGIIMAVSYANATFSPSHDTIRTSHYSLGLIGWIAPLIIAVAFQVVEMFYVTTPYSPWCKQNVFRIIAGSLLLKILFLFLTLPYLWVFDMMVAALFTGFVVTTALRLRMRKRRVSDVSIWFWGMGIALLQLALIFHIGYLWSGNLLAESIALIAFSLFALSIILGMMSKIVPFLVWFHLSAQGFMDAPIMSNVIPQNRSKGVFWLFLITAAFAVISPLYPLALSVSGGFGAMMFTLLLANLLGARRLYHRTLTHGTRFEQL
ncbi:MAG: hypothetical protein M0P91_01865 [Sulfuricurvum sp.]|uniref:hypothetical protein n=1 Tax=Sulfuricurvum sp. TaxID=2025608 RepID=UPI0025E3DBAE|nr:hypothetical protein [Sulfuricurvum sp.]MCK9371917.1 hypothetical protein [Sulfuricurvum sp.]